MPTPASNLLVGPLMGWLTVVALFVIGYLARLELIERRKNRRMDGKRAALEKGAPLKPKIPRPLAMRNTVEAAPLIVDSPILRGRFPELHGDRSFNLRPIDLN
jgi:hypothetical protein